MSPATQALPVRRRDLRIEPVGRDGDHVVKDPRSGAFFLLGDREHFLLERLDGRADAGALADAYERRFGEALDEEDLRTWLGVADAQGLLESDAPPPPPRRQSLLYWRRRLWDPDRLFGRLVPRLGLLWTRGFLVLSGAAVLLAGLVLWDDREQLGLSARAALRWDSLLLGWAVLAGVGVLHECAHGLTCKRHGGEVREIGVLFLYFMPCFYCNVSDAWLFREKSKRLQVMVAGAWCDLVVWAVAVFLWRVTEPDTLLHRAAFLALGLAGLDTLFNLNPLIKLDGYYLLSDWQEVPNLRQRAFERVKAHARRLLWGAPPPEPDPRGRFVTGFGVLSWGFTALFAGLSVAVCAAWLHGRIGAAGQVVAGALVLPAAGELFRGLCAGEVRAMIGKRRLRTLVWTAALGGVGAALCLVEVDEYAGGTFTVRSTVREEVRGPAAGFLATICKDEGDRVEAGETIARLKVPDLAARLDQNRAELEEARAVLALLEGGTRPEVLAEQRGRVERAVRWHDEAAKDLDRARRALVEELSAFDERLAEAAIQRDGAEADFARIEGLSAKRVATREQLEKADLARRVAVTRIALVGAEKRERVARGTAAAEQEVARRARELADDRARLAVLEAGPRPEEVAAQRAKLDRLAAETRRLERLRADLEVRSTVAGTVVTPRLRERTGQWCREGDLVCVVEQPSSAQAEIALEEEKLRGVRPGLRVRLKLRAMPHETLKGRVSGIATSADREDERAQGTVTVRCSLDRPVPLLRPSMSGYARVYTGRRTLGAVLLDWPLRLLRTEFWW